MTALEKLANNLKKPVVDLEKMTLKTAVEEGVRDMSDGRLAAIPLAGHGIPLTDNHERYALQADGITVGEIVVDGQLTSRKLYAGVQGVLKNQPGYPVAFTTPVPATRKY